MHNLLLRSIAHSIHTKLNLSLRMISECLSVPKSTIYRWLHSNNSSTASNTVSSPFSTRKTYCSIIEKYLSNNPSSRLRDVQQHLVATHSASMSLSTICRYLRLLGISWKKASFQEYNNLRDLEE